jgi:phosphate:Na+ symporter
MFSFEMVISIIGGLSIFLYGMKIMSDGLQKVAGTRMRITLNKLTNNRFSGVFTGFFITAAVQSSSATTVMLVSFVNAGLMNLTQSLGVILGANIGTTVTGWIVALLGFKIKIALFALPAIAVGFFVRYTGNQKITDWGESLLGFGFLFFGLTIMKAALGDLKHSQEVITLMSKYHASGLLSLVVVVAIGAAITMAIQSSSATMALTLTLANQGIIDYPTCAALILGENIGTTVTANIAAIGASTTAKRAALAHMIFNVLGVIWILLLFYPFLRLVDAIVPGNIYSSSASEIASIIPGHLAAFHTLFNVLNMIIFLPFIGTLAWVSKLLVRGTPKTEKSHLLYLSSTLINTPPLALEESKRELRRMSENVMQMLNSVMELFNKKEVTAVDYNRYSEKIVDLEYLVDTLEREITNFLVLVIRNTTSKEISEEISEILNAVNNLERMGDPCESLLKLMKRIYENNLHFTDDAVKDINTIADKVQKLLTVINENITNRKTNIMSLSNSLEADINTMRHEMRKAHIDRLNKGSCDVNQGLVFIDMLNSFEKIGDHAYNIAQSISGVR